MPAASNETKSPLPPLPAHPTLVLASSQLVIDPDLPPSDKLEKEYAAQAQHSEHQMKAELKQLLHKIVQ